MINLAEIIEGISGKEGSSGYVRFNTIAGGPYFQGNAGNITVKVVYNRSESPITIYNNTYSLFKYRGGNLVGVSGEEDFRGTNSLIIVNNVYPLGHVYVNESNGAWIVIDFARIGILNLGVFNFSKGIENDTPVFEVLNVIEIHYIDIVPGSFGGSGGLYTVATCQSVNITYYRISAGYDALNFTVTATPSNRLESYSLGIDSNYGSLIIFVKSIIRIDIFGG